MDLDLYVLQLFEKLRLKVEIFLIKNNKNASRKK